ncbi:MKI67 FHA domain-interacting nucleolar phosphoprotein-like [Tribolium castaneum]|uniref:MKI67 FHA domain-interacting nucleolar phosphoprotein-like n=1 Tax=Tribolium castaneum TaxID=7070 RepID=D6WB41_TRICA|nr:PREDICTED: MKI67 FHA domain-interacting nucleolar phosphoprotein-like [Tribolium castaneum]EEZ98973.1 MKI67 FHA domain-interacting nucleolar phosphoprotein-like [Tribolium castaneum]|eukprot:XP_008200832.1 PREDICTED: MKI67 FHA domain-interacting nucleolar phosphoprotein-like [Tribolium castaneum]
MKTSETISLDKNKQRSVTAKTKKLKKAIKSGRIAIRENRKEKRLNAEKARGLIYIAHLPHGFYEEEITKYFKQFGRVTNVKVCRSRNNGNSKGFGYVEFAHPEVAKIAAETMNNYIMFKKRIVAEFVPQEKRPKSLFHGKQSMPQKFSKQRQRLKNAKTKNKEIDDETHLEQSKSRLTRLQKRLQKINKFGIDYDLKPVDVPKGVNKKVSL